MPTVHNQAAYGEIAKTVLLPGDPLRAKVIAETFLEDAVQFNSVRNMFGYTGTYKGRKISVMGSGMGMASLGIYAYELYKEYGVETIIRVGSAGAYVEDLKLFDIVVVDEAFTESSYAKVMDGTDEDVHFEKPSEEVSEQLKKSANELGIAVRNGRIHSSDVFYHLNENYRKDVDEAGCIAVEMESFSLFHIAKALGKKAGCLLTISDSFVHPEVTTHEQRQNSFKQMMRIALEAAVNL